MRNIKQISIYLLLAITLTGQFEVNASDNQQEIALIQNRLKLLQRRLSELETRQKQAKNIKRDYGVTLYGSLRPALTISDFGKGNTSTDVSDFYSRIGFKGQTALNADTSAFFQGEWDIDIEADADFGNARLGFVGLKGKFGKIAIGKQYNPHYNTVAVVTDIFHNRASPFAYDEAGPARTNQLITYSYANKGFTLEAGVQFNGHTAYSAGGDNTQANQRAHIDSNTLGVGYNMGDIYLGASYLDQKINKENEKEFFSLAASWRLTHNTYLAATYRDIQSAIGGSRFSQSSFDIATSYALSESFIFKTAYFQWDGDGQGRTFDGYNFTLENKLHDSVLVFIEWLTRDVKNNAQQHHLSLGMRYDFEAMF